MKYFPVVGVLERFNDTLNVLEWTYPQFFEGASTIYYDQVLQYYSYSELNHKRKVSNVVKSIVRQNFTQDHDFYLFCTQILGQQLSEIKKKY